MQIRRLSCTTTELSKLLTSCLTAVKNHVIRYCEKVYERSGKNWFWVIKNSGEVLNKLKSRGFRATSLSTYDFSTLYTTLPHNLIKEKLINLIEWTFKREGSPYVACNERQAFFTFFTLYFLSRSHIFFVTRANPLERFFITVSHFVQHLIVVKLEAIFQRYLHRCPLKLWLIYERQTSY